MKSHAPNNYDCPLCRVVAGQEDGGETVVWRDEFCVAAIALHQQEATLGSLLLFPVQHHENIYLMPAKSGAHMFNATKLLAIALKQAFSCAGVTVRQNNEPAGGQDVWHYHVHITPRYEHEGELSNTLVVAPATQRLELAARVRHAISGA
jgi:histidine triad (HIT) family protein